MSINEFDHLPDEKKRELLSQCCGSSAWVEKMIAAPWAEDLFDLEETAEEKWYECSEQDWLEAFAAHPKIGDVASLEEKYRHTARWAADEQSQVNIASSGVIQELSTLNEEYEKKFGFIFIVFATGKSAEEMLELLKERLPNDRDEEIKNAAEEQLKITKKRLEKLFID